MSYEQKKVSVIVPIYNVENYLTKCIESIRNQTYRNIEILLIDDGSKDSCPQLCDKASTVDNRIQVVHQLNQGRSAARNRGLNDAKGEYIFFVDGDDWIDENCIEILYEACEKHHATLAVGRYRLVYPDRIEDDSTGELLLLEGEQPIEFYVRGYQKYQIANSVCVKLYRRDLLKGIRFVEGKYFEDIMFVTRVYGSCRRCVYLDTALYNYNIATPTSITFSGVTELTFRDEIPTFSEKQLYLKNLGRHDLADTYSAFKYQRLLTYYRDCKKCKGNEAKKFSNRIKKIIKSERKTVKRLCDQKEGKFLERLELKIFLLNSGLYVMFYMMLELYGKNKGRQGKND